MLEQNFLFITPSKALLTNIDLNFQERDSIALFISIKIRN